MGQLFKTSQTGDNAVESYCKHQQAVDTANSTLHGCNLLRDCHLSWADLLKVKNRMPLMDIL
jgi:hypothetical protein